MIVDFDPAKDEANRTKHGVSLTYGIRIFEDENHILFPSLRPVDGEDRYEAVGMIEERLWTAVHVRRGDTVRLISVRRSNDGKQREYHRNPA